MFPLAGFWITNRNKAGAGPECGSRGGGGGECAAAQLRDLRQRALDRTGRIPDRVKRLLDEVGQDLNRLDRVTY
jgi:hypothetical protein